MFYSVLTAIAAFLLSGKLWVAFLGFILGALTTGFCRRRIGRVLEGRGGVADARVLKQICYSNDNGPEDKEYTVLVRFRNGERFRYILRGDGVLFNKLLPYLK